LGSAGAESVVLLPEQKDVPASVIVADAGFGFTVTVTVIGVPVQVVPAFVKDGVMVNVTVIGEAVVLVKLPEIFPDPLAAIPVTVAVLSLVQLKTVPATGPFNTIPFVDVGAVGKTSELGFGSKGPTGGGVLKLIPVILVPEHTDWLGVLAVTVGIGLIITVAVTGVPLQVLTGVMVNVTVIGASVVLVNEPEISPEPLAAIPVAEVVLSLVQV
jgi:hypothetical protein